MKQVGQMWLPDNDEHFYLGAQDRPIYQKKAFKAAAGFVKNFDSAVDIGAHVGFFTLYMAEKFLNVHAFEPEPENFACLKRNVLEHEMENVVCWDHGIAERDMLGNMVNPAWHNSGAWEFHENSLGTARVMKLGSNITPDLIKIDVQGMEGRALLGCHDVLMRDKPVLLVECERGDTVSTYLKSIGYNMAERTGSNITWIHG